MSSEGARQQDEQQDSVRHDLLSAMRELKAREEPADTGQASAVPAETGTTDQAAAQPQTGDRARDASGRFAPKTEVADPATQPAAAAAPAPDAQPADPNAAVQPKPIFKAPDGWSGPMKAKFATLDPEVQAEISRRESQLTQKITSQDEERDLGRKVRTAAQPYAAIMQAEGATIDTAFQSFMNYNFIMRQGTPQQKVQAILNVARQWNVPLQEALQQPQSNVALHPAIETLEQRLNRIEQAEQAQREERQRQEDARIADEIEAFAQDPAHIYFETVKAHMGALMSNGLAKSLQDAYDQACNAHPDIRSTLAAAQAATAQQKQVRIAEDAKRAAGSVTGGPGASQPAAQAQQQGSGSIRDDIMAAMAQHRGAARI